MAPRTYLPTSLEGTFALGAQFLEMEMEMEMEMEKFVDSDLKLQELFQGHL